MLLQNLQICLDYQKTSDIQIRIIGICSLKLLEIPDYQTV